MFSSGLASLLKAWSVGPLVRSQNGNERIPAPALAREDIVTPRCVSFLRCSFLPFLGRSSNAKTARKRQKVKKVV